jgi:hypothetical protein
MSASSIGPAVLGRFLLGEYEDLHGHAYLMLVNKDLSHSFHFHIRLKQADQKLFRISPYTGHEEPFGGEMDWLAPGAGVLLRVE